MRNGYDVLIVGGGVVGSAIAYFLAVDPAFDGSILVVERDPTYADCATARSWGGIRQQFSTPENILMSIFGAQFAREAGERLEVAGERPALGFREQGYLFLASDAGLGVLRENCGLQCSLGAATQLLSVAQLRERFPWLNTADLAGGGFGPENEGWIDPYALLRGLRRKAQALGVEYRHDEVVDVLTDTGRIQAAYLRRDGKTTCGILINAAGPHAGVVAGMVGVGLPVTPRKRMSYVFDCREDLRQAPLTIDPSGVAFRPEGGQYIAIVSPPEQHDPDCDDLELEYGLFEEVIWPMLAQRVPAFEAIKLTGAWAGHYDYNSVDQNAVLGFHSEIKGLVFCNGFSGHGLQQAPAAGRAIAELIVYGEYRSLDLSALAYHRLLENQPLKERNVV